MSSITFPYGHGSMSSAGGAAGDLEDHFSPTFDGMDSSFQMNPLSSHPPRTPRTSVISSQTHGVYGYEPFGSSEDTRVPTRTYEEDTENGDEQDDKARAAAESRVTKEEIWREVLLTSNGRDKAFVRPYSTAWCAASIAHREFCCRCRN